MKKLRIFTEVHDLAFGIPKAEVWNSEFQWHSEFRTSAHRIAMAIPRAEVRNRHLHGQKFRPIESWLYFLSELIYLAFYTELNSKCLNNITEIRYHQS